MPENLNYKYARVAEGLGASAQRVEAVEDLGPAIRQGLAANKEGQPALLEVMTKVEENVPSFW